MNTKSTTFLIFFVALSFITAVLSLILPFIDNKIIDQYLRKSIQALPLINDKQFLMFLSTYLLIHYLLINLVNGPKWKNIITCAQKIIQNTLLHGFILYMLFINVEKHVATSFACYLYIWLFSIGRIFFSMGYLFGTASKFQILRSPGFAICFGAQFGMLFLALNINLDQYVPI